jgi:hypothetical protein
MDNHNPHHFIHLAQRAIDCEPIVQPRPHHHLLLAMLPIYKIMALGHTTRPSPDYIAQMFHYYSHVLLPHFYTKETTTTLYDIQNECGNKKLNFIIKV